MTEVQSFAFNPFQENTYVLYGDTKEGVIIDPGCYNQSEHQQLLRFIDQYNLKVVHLLNTHAHIDHVLGNKFVAEQWGLKLEMNRLDLPNLHNAPNHGKMFGFEMEPSPEPSVFLNEGDQITFGNTVLDIVFVPGHAPGHIAFISYQDKFVIGGDVLFQRSIGRTDLPGGDYDTLIQSIKDKLYTLPDDYIVYPGHGPATSIGFEKKNNPFVRG